MRLEPLCQLFLIGEGEIDEEREDWWLHTYVCVNEEAQGPPAIGAEPSGAISPMRDDAGYERYWARTSDPPI
jgi:hypothetical protein